MTTEPDSTPRRRPPTIDLTATEVEAEKPAAAQESGTGDGAHAPSAGAPCQEPEAAGVRPRSHIGAMAGGAAAGAILVGAIVAGLWFFGYWPPRQSAAAESAPAPAASGPAIAEIAAELKQLQGAIQAQKPDAALASRAAAAEAAAKAQADALAALNRRVDEIAAVAQNALAQGKAATDTAAGAADAAKRAAQAAVARGDVDALSARIAALDGTVKALSDTITHPSSTADDRAARLTVAAEALRAAVERGAPYQAELAAATALGVDRDDAAPLEPFAAAGVPSAAALAQELASLAPGLRRTMEPAASGTSFLDRLESNAQRLVRVSPVDAPAGDDAASVVARINVDAAHADIAAARADVAKLPAAAKAIVAPWAEKAQAREAAIAAARRIAAAALAALGKPASQ